MECGCFGVLQGGVIVWMFDTPAKALGLNAVIALCLLRYDALAVASCVRRVVTGLCIG